MVPAIQLAMNSAPQEDHHLSLHQLIMNTLTQLPIDLQFSHNHWGWWPAYYLPRGLVTTPPGVLQFPPEPLRPIYQLGAQPPQCHPRLSDPDSCTAQASTQMGGSHPGNLSPPPVQGRVQLLGPRVDCTHQQHQEEPLGRETRSMGACGCQRAVLQSYLRCPYNRRPLVPLSPAWKPSATWPLLFCQTLSHTEPSWPSWVP